MQPSRYQPAVFVGCDSLRSAMWITWPPKRWRCIPKYLKWITLSGAAILPATNRLVCHTVVTVVGATSWTLHHRCRSAFELIHRYSGMIGFTPSLVYPIRGRHVQCHGIVGAGIGRARLDPVVPAYAPCGASCGRVGASPVHWLSSAMFRHTVPHAVP